MILDLVNFKKSVESSKGRLTMDEEIKYIKKKIKHGTCGSIGGSKENRSEMDL